MKLYRTILTTLGATLLLACQNDRPEPGGEGGGTPGTKPGREKVELTLTVEKNQPVTVSRTAATPASGTPGMEVVYNTAPGQTKALADDTEFQISDLWILQFAEYGMLLASEHITSLPEPTEEHGMLQYRVPIHVERASGCSIFFIANAGASDFSSLWSIDDFKALEKNGFNESNMKDGAGRLLMSGSYTGNIPGKVYTMMHRLASKLRLTLNYENPLAQDGPVLTLNTAKIQRVPNTISYFHGIYDDPAWTYPTAAGGNFQDYADRSLGGATNGPVELEWYMPENQRGVNPAIEDQQKLKNAENDPSYSGGESYATRVVLEGTYNQENYPAARWIRITLYPGANNHSSYNISRNSFYDMGVNIRHIDSDDTRIDLEPVYKVTYEYYDGKKNDPDTRSRLIDPETGEAAEFVYYGRAGEAVRTDQEIYRLFAPSAEYDEKVEDDSATIVSTNEAGNIVQIWYWWPAD